jgi:hypothetical protein
LIQRQRAWAASTSLKAIARPAARESAPLVTRDGEVEIVLQPSRSDVPVTLNGQAYFAHLDFWLASSDPLFCEFSPAA